MRRQFLIASLIALAIIGLGAVYLPWILWSLALVGPLLLLGFQDYFQTRSTVRRNFPLIGRFRYLFEAIRPEIYQYFIESNSDGMPFSREIRSIIYQRSKCALDTLPFGTQHDVYETGYEWVNHSLVARHVDHKQLRVKIGGPDCTKPYSASLLNISAMSYGALSANAVLALNGGAKDGDFAHNTGEGGVSPYHLEPGGDLIWQVGTGYFGCRTPDGNFCPDTFAERAVHENIKMIEIKLSQGAKPGHGGILPGRKVSQEIAQIRHVPLGKDVISPPTHSVFSTPLEMMKFIKSLRELSGGKPVGFKLCMGKRREFIALLKAMETTGITPDFISIDGGEGGTGAAPLEFSNHIGAPGIESLIFAHNTLVGFSLRDRVRLFASGKVSTGIDMVKRLALGADVLYSARAMMLSLGCIQAIRCNANVCPTGITTQDPNLTAGLHVPDKRRRVCMYHTETMKSFAEILGAMGLDSAPELRPWHIMRRTSPTEIKHYGELFEWLNDRDLLGEKCPGAYSRAMGASSAESFQHTGAA